MEPYQVRACYPQIEVRSTSYSRSESTLPYGFLHTPGIYRTTVTAPDLFRNYFQDQFAVILKNHGGTIDIGESDTPIPLHFAVAANERIDGAALNALNIPLRDVFDAPDLGNTDDEIANGTFVPPRGGPYPLAAFTAPRVDYSLFRLSHYTGTDASHFQNFVIFTNYAFYIDEFCRVAKQYLADGHTHYESFIEPGNVVTGRRQGGGNVARAGAANARLSSDRAERQRHNHGQYRRGSLQRQDHYRPYRRVAAACLDHAGTLRRSA